MKSGTSDDTHAHVARQRPAWPTRPGGRAPRARGTRSSLVLGVLVLAAVVSTRWVCVNVSPSAPYGLYRLRPVPASLTRGMLVVLPTPDVMRAWHGLPLLKPVAGVPGDLACALNDRLDINGEDYGPILSGAQGKPLPRWYGCTVVREREVVVASQARRSLDSRYFGPVPIEALTAVAEAVWTWGR